VVLSYEWSGERGINWFHLLLDTRHE